MTVSPPWSFDAAERSHSHLTGLWQADKPARGLWSTCADPVVAEVLAASPADYVCIDLQHGFATSAELPSLVQAMRSAGRAPIVRVGAVDAAQVTKAIDLGAFGVISPLVDTADDARLVATACRYPAAGVRSWGPPWSGIVPGQDAMPAQHNARTICIAQIETREGLANVEAIAQTDGIDGLYIGPHDLALRCGYGRATFRDSTAVHELIDQIVAAGRAAGVVVGLHCSDRAMADYWIARGVRMVTLTHDLIALGAAIAAQF